MASTPSIAKITVSDGNMTLIEGQTQWTDGKVAMTDDILATVALTVATKAAEGIAEGGKAAFAALVSLVRRRFRGHPSAEVALADAESDPADEMRIHSLRDALARQAADDPDFAAELRRLWQQLHPHLIADDSGVINHVSGPVAGNVVQARDVHGGISFGDVR